MLESAGSAHVGHTYVSSTSLTVPLYRTFTTVVHLVGNVRKDMKTKSLHRYSL